MTQVTTQDIERIVNGEPVEITDVDYPLDDQPSSTKWYMRQPTDWLLDMADAVYDAARAQAFAMPEMEGAKSLPPTDTWLENQKQAIADNKRRIKELESNEHRTPEEDLELLTAKDLAARLIQPDKYTRAEQIAHDTGNKARQSWLLPRLIVDGKGKLLFDPNTKDGQARWQRVGRNVKSDLLSTYTYVQVLVSIAKNSKPGQSSN